MLSKKSGFGSTRRRSKSVENVSSAQGPSSVPRFARTPSNASSKYGQSMQIPLTTPKMSCGSAMRSIHQNRSGMKLKFDCGTPTLAPTGKESLSPRQLKMHYTNMDEKHCLFRVRQFVANHDPCLDIQKPTTINQFIAVVQLLLSILCGPSTPAITLKNYKEKLPNRMKELDFPMNISQTFLKCPNTPQNFNQVLAIWIFLLDIVDDASGELNDMDAVDNARFMYVHNLDAYNEDEVLADFVATLYDKKDTTKEAEATQCRRLSHEVDVCKTLAQQCELEVLKLQEEDRVLCEQLEACDLRMQSNEPTTIMKFIKERQVEIEHKHNRKIRLLEEGDLRKQQIDGICTKIESLDVKENSVMQASSELARRQRQLRLLSLREQQFREQVAAVQQHNDDLIARVEEMIFQHNTALKFDYKLPIHIKNKLYLNEHEINFTQIKLVASELNKLMGECPSEHQKLQLKLKTLASDLSSVEAALEHAENERRMVQLGETEKENYIQILMTDINSMKLQLENERAKKFELYSIAEKNREKYLRQIDLYKRKKAELESYLSQMFCIGEQSQELVKGKVQEFVRLQEEFLELCRNLKND